MDLQSFEKYLQLVDPTHFELKWKKFINKDGKLKISDVFKNKNLLPTYASEDIQTIKELRQLTISLDSPVDANDMIHQHRFKEFLDKLKTKKTQEALSILQLYDTSESVTPDAVQRIKKAMTNHPTNPDVQAKACETIWNLAVNNDNCVTLMKENVLELIKKAMTNHPTHPDVQQSACGTLLNLAVNNENKVTLMKENVLELIKKAMTNHPTHPAVQQYACRTLWNLAVNNDNKVTLMKENVLELIKKAMTNHPTHPDVQQYACATLWNLALN